MMTAVRAPVAISTFTSTGVVSHKRATQSRLRMVVVRSSAEPPQQNEQPSVVRPHSTAPKASAFEDVMGFAGAAPEIINGRLAQLGFLAAVGAELATGKPTWAQFSSASGPVFVTAAVFIVASLIPIFKGVKNDESFGPLTPKAELTNGRFAMLGFAALLIVEGIKGSALF